MSTFETATERFKEVLKNPYSSFYRKLYEGKIPDDDDFPHTLDEWERIPLLTKQMIMDTPFYDRIFIPFHEMDVVRITSGTTATGVLAIPRRNLRPIPELKILAPYTKVLSFFYPHHLHGFFDGSKQTHVVGGDAARLEASAKLAAEAEVEIIQGMPSLILRFASVLKDHYEMSRIKWLQFTAERCTMLQYAALKREYPNAHFQTAYASSEMQGWAAVSPEKEIENFPFAVRSRPDYFFELADENGRSIRENGIEGELIASVLHSAQAFPVIRYRTGDRAVMLARDDGSCVFSLLGRTEGDRVRFAGGLFLAEEIERAVSSTAPYVIDLEAEVHEKDDPPLPYLLLRVASASVGDLAVYRELAVRLSRELKINERYTYAEAVEKGFCAPLECRTLQETSRKRKRLTDARAV